jgi:hypothetical protein
MAERLTKPGPGRAHPAVKPGGGHVDKTPKRGVPDKPAVCRWSCQWTTGILFVNSLTWPAFVVGGRSGCLLGDAMDRTLTDWI